MTIAELKQYRSICAEIRDIESDIGGSYAGDTVQSGSRFPYSKHTVRIEGYVPGDSTTTTLARLSELRRKKTEVEDFVNQIGDYKIKSILIYKYIEGLSWIQISFKPNINLSADACRMKLKRYISKYSNRQR